VTNTTYDQHFDDFAAKRQATSQFAATPGNPLAFNPSTVQGGVTGGAYNYSGGPYQASNGAWVTPNPGALVNMANTSGGLDQRTQQQVSQLQQLAQLRKASSQLFGDSSALQSAGQARNAASSGLSQRDMAERYGAGQGFRDNAFFLPHNQPGYVPPEREQMMYTPETAPGNVMGGDPSRRDRFADRRSGRDERDGDLLRQILSRLFGR
jgi:hypothetical protein